MSTTVETADLHVREVGDVGWWAVTGDDRLSYAGGATMAQALEALAEEADDVGVADTATVVVEDGSREWTVTVADVKQDYGW